MITGELFSNIHVNMNDSDIIPALFNQSHVEAAVYCDIIQV